MKIFISILLVILSNWAVAQTLVSGKVIDENGRPIPYANIMFKKSNIGTYSDADGNFTLKSATNHHSVEVSCIGFSNKTIRLKNHHTNDLQIVLIEGEQLDEVIVISKPKKHLSKKENPAYRILQNIWKHKHKNGLKQVDYYQYKKHISTELGLNKLDSTFLQKALQSDYHSVKDILSEKKFKQYFSIPMYLKEEVTQTYGDNKNKQQRTDMEAERIQGVVQNGFGLERISRAFQEFDVYDNSFIILDKPFVSPVSEYGYGVYSYVLSDSIVRDQKKFYTIHFFPRKDQDLVFQGKFVVNDQNYAIESIQMHTIKETSINLVRNLSFEKYFKVLNDSVFLPEKDLYEGDFTILSKDDNEKGIYVKKVVTYSDYILNSPKKAPNFYQENITRYQSNQFKQDDKYWQHFGNDKEMFKTKSIIAQVGGNRKIRSISDAINIISTGYLPVNNYLQLGSVWEAYSANDVEGTRFKVGLRSFISPEDRFRAYGYFAYGTRDNKLKYAISGKYLLFHQPRILIGGEFKNDYAQLGSVLQTDDTHLGFQKPVVMWFERGDNYYLTHNKRLQGVVDMGILGSNLHFTLSGVYQQLKPANPSFFSIGYQKDGQNFEKYSDAHLGFSITYTPGRNVYGFGVEQRYGRNVHPMYKIKYTQGFSGIRNSAFDYSKIEGMFSYPLPVWSIGMLHTTLETGKTFGTIPLPFLSPTPANQTYSVVDRTFALLDYYDFVNDDFYLNMYFEHHFNGFIFNRLPLIYKTKWRSLIFARTAYGTISERNQKISLSNVFYNPAHRLYWEYGFGIENIGLGNFRFVRVDFVWRNDFNDVNGVKNPYFGVRVKIRPEF